MKFAASGREIGTGAKATLSIHFFAATIKLPLARTRAYKITRPPEPHGQFDYD
jgi:hypothetical protein